VAKGRRFVRTAFVVLLFGLTGCSSGLYPVRGTVKLEDGTPLAKGMVIFEKDEGGKSVMARGELKPDGSFQLGTNKPGDGVPAGKYRVLINSMDISDVPDEKKVLPFDNKYLKYETSGLEFEVKAGENEFPITLARGRRIRR